MGFKTFTCSWLQPGPDCGRQHPRLHIPDAGASAPAIACTSNRNSLNEFQDFRLKNGSSQGQIIALTVLFVLNSPDSGWGNTFCRRLPGKTAPVIACTEGFGCGVQGRCRANMAHIRQSRPDSGLGFQATVLETVEVVSSLPGSGLGARAIRPGASAPMIA